MAHASECRSSSGHDFVHLIAMHCSPPERSMWNTVSRRAKQASMRSSSKHCIHITAQPRSPPERSMWNTVSRPSSTASEAATHTTSVGVTSSTCTGARCRNDQ